MEAAQFIASSEQLGMDNGSVIAVPIPQEHSASGEEVEKAIEIALRNAEYVL